MSIELDGNGNTVRSNPVVADSDLSKQTRSVGQADLIKEIEALRDDMLYNFRERLKTSDEVKALCIRQGDRILFERCLSQSRAYEEVIRDTREKFSALLSKIKN